MQTKSLTFLLALTFLFMFSGSSVVFGDDFDDGLDAYQKQDYKTAHKLWLPLAEQGYGLAQYNLGVMYRTGRGIPQDYVSAHVWFKFSGSNENKNAVINRNIAEKKMTQQQIEEAQRLARNWKPIKK